MCVLVKQRTSLPDSTLKSDIVYGDRHTRQLSMPLSYTMKNKTTKLLQKLRDRFHFRKWSGNESDRKWSGNESDRKWSGNESGRKWSGNESGRKWSGNESDRKWSGSVRVIFTQTTLNGSNLRGRRQHPSIGGVAHVGVSGCHGDSGRAEPTHGLPPAWGWDEGHSFSGVAATGAMVGGLSSP